jgi:hypothetical protein
MQLTRKRGGLKRWIVVPVLVGATVRADEALDARLQELEQRQDATESSIGALSEEQRRLATQLTEARGRQALAAADEQARVARVRAVDDLLAQAADADLVLMAGGRPAATLGGMSSEVAALVEDAGARSGRLEFDRLRAAGVSLAQSRTALAEADWLRARNHLAGAAAELAGAREAAAGNPNRAAGAR